MCAGDLIGEDLGLIFISFSHTSQYYILLLFLCSFDCKWNLLSGRFNIVYIVDNNIGYLLRDVCWLIHGYNSYNVYLASYKLDNAPFV